MTDPRPPVLRRRDALARGYTDAELRTLCRTGGWARLRPGSYLSPDAQQELDDAGRHRALLGATLPGVSGDAVVSHQSAAVLHGLTLWRIPLDRMHITRDRSGGGRRTRHLHSHSAPLSARDVVEVNGIPVTNVARTVADLCRTLPFEQAVVVGDNALANPALTRDAVAGALEYAAGRPGHPAACRALAFLDGRSESVGESRSRVALSAVGSEIPELQASLLDPDGLLLGRVDFLFADAGVVGEFDGRVEYGKYLCAPDRNRATRCSPRSSARTGSGTRAGRWCGGRGATSTTRTRSTRDFVGRRSGVPAGRDHSAPCCAQVDAPHARSCARGVNLRAA